MLFLELEAFASSKLEGIYRNKTFLDYLKDKSDYEILKYKKYKWKISYEELCLQLKEKYSGEYKYVGDFYLIDYDLKITLFKNLNPNKEKKHKKYPFLYLKDNELFISAFNTNEFEKLNKRKL